MPHPTCLGLDESALLVVDVQEKLLPKIAESEAVLASVAFLIDVATLLDVPRIATEQYPKGLGPTVSSLVEKLPTPRPEKLTFSCCGIATLADDLWAQNRFRVVLTGIETHICVQQTALDLIARDFWVYVPVDAVGSRRPLDRDVALRRLESAGAVLTTSEAIAFEWLGSAEHPRFREVSALVRARG